MRMSITILFATMIALSAPAFANEPGSYIEKFFNEANKDNMEEVCAKYYHPDIEFVDPVGTIKTLEKMTSYYQHLYENLKSIEFVISKEVRNGDDIFAAWAMTMAHPRVNGGEEFTIEGASHVRLQDGKIIYHLDYFDLGAMIYERVPVLGMLVRYVKRKLADH